MNKKTKSTIRRVPFLCAAGISVCMMISFCACRAENVQKTDTVRVVCTVFPAYDWAKNIIGGEGTLGEANIRLELLIKNGVDPHSFQPTAADIVSLSTCDVLVYVGGESEKWITDVLRDAVNKDMITLKLLDVLGERAKTEAIIEGMQEEAAHVHNDASAHEHAAHNHDASLNEHEPHNDKGAHSHDASVEGAHGTHTHDASLNEHEPHNDKGAHTHDASVEGAHDFADPARVHGTHTHAHDAHNHAASDADYDEHVWLSLKNAQIFCEAIASALSRADAANADTYAKNARAYTAELSALDGEYARAVQSATHKTLVVADRFPLRYLVDDYGIEYFAAFPGCSAETEASFETIIFLAQKIDSLNVTSVLTIEGARHRIAKTVIENTRGKNMQTLVFDSLQSVSQNDMANGVTYLSVMKKNLSVLTDALH